MTSVAWRNAHPKGPLVSLLTAVLVVSQDSDREDGILQQGVTKCPLVPLANTRPLSLGFGMGLRAATRPRPPPTRAGRRVPLSNRPRSECFLRTQMWFVGAEL